MKSIILTLLACIGLQSYAQTTKTFTYNPKKKNIDGKFDLKKDSSYVFKLIDINTGRQAIAIKATGKKLKTDLPKGLEAMFPFLTNNLIDKSDFTNSKTLSESKASDQFLKSHLTQYFTLSGQLKSVLTAVKQLRIV